jgi:hypothetical protein
VGEARRRRPIAPGDVVRIKVLTHPRWLRVCDIKAPRTGLEAKFSYVLLAAMVMQGVDTAAETSYTDALCRDQGLGALAARVEVSGKEALSDTQCEVDIELAGGGHVESAYDLAAPISEEVLAAGLRARRASWGGGR